MNKMDELYQKVSRDSSLQEKLRKILDNGNPEEDQAVQTMLVNFAAEQGYMVAYEDIRNYFLGLTEEKARELADAELDMVAGGKTIKGLFMSIITIGLYCMIASIDRAIKSDEGCHLH